MTVTFIDTNKIPAVRLPDAQGRVAEILNRDLCGAENVVGKLRWLEAGDTVTAEALPENQLVYLMDGEGVITLNGTDYEVAKGAGIYLAPSETATIRQRGKGPLKLFHLVVPRP